MADAMSSSSSSSTSDPKARSSLLSAASAVSGTNSPAALIAATAHDPADPVTVANAEGKIRAFVNSANTITALNVALDKVNANSISINISSAISVLNQGNKDPA
eukprot:gb/GEZN01004776.1/.p3 GENE.gb/GEZN01004776.1/~~gb/GEZN01004776.1/.p3  ORF type:complete len:104 (+),score=17.55 gb/GEZN01004776.1/:946-1257(+)